MSKNIPATYTRVVTKPRVVSRIQPSIPVMRERSALRDFIAQKYKSIVVQQAYSRKVGNENDIYDTKDLKKHTSISSRSKRITKENLLSSTTLQKPQYAARQVLQNISNIPSRQVYNSHSIIERLDDEVKNIGKNERFLEDDIYCQTASPEFVTLRICGRSNAEQHCKFQCFREKELNFPERFTEKLKAHSCDNDVTTDEEQIKSAIRNLHRSLIEFVNIQKQETKSK